MYRLLIADDEALEREGIEWIITRMMPDTFDISHAENGRIAIQKAEQFHPHIIMMDVRMPGIQGLEALKEIKAHNPYVKMVLVTAYEYFEYAREALSLGVKEYIVKPAKRTQIVELLQRLVMEIDKEHNRREEQLEMRDRLSQLLPLAETEIALNFMTDQVNELEVDQLADILELSIERGCALVLAFPELGEEKRRIYETVKKVTQEVAKGRSGSVVSSMLHSHMAIFLFEQKRASGGETVNKQGAAIGSNLLEALFQKYGITISIGVGSVRASIEGIRRSYFEAVFASSYENKWGSIRCFEDLNIGAEGGEGEAVNSLLPDGTSVREGAYVELAIQQIREEREQRTHHMVDRAVRFIQEGFQEELSLEDVAEHVHLNPYYFSKVFKQQTGETFIDYVTSLRIEKAKEWMRDSQLSMKEVCYLVGYKDPNYFSRVFKKVTGVTPSEYRIRLQQ